MIRRILTIVVTVGLVGTLTVGVSAVAIGVMRESAIAVRDREAELAAETSPPPVRPRPPTPSPSPAATSTIAPAEIYDGPLIAPDGFLVHTDAEIEAVLRERAPADLAAADIEIGIAQELIVRDCMAEAGFLWDPIAPNGGGSAKPSWFGRGLTPDEAAAYRLALGGENDDFPYNWRDAGCHGRAVHETGQDDAH